MKVGLNFKNNRGVALADGWPDDLAGASRPLFSHIKQALPGEVYNKIRGVNCREGDEVWRGLYREEIDKKLSDGVYLLKNGCRAEKYGQVGTMKSEWAWCIKCKGDSETVKETTDDCPCEEVTQRKTYYLSEQFIFGATPVLVDETRIVCKPKNERIKVLCEETNKANAGKGLSDFVFKRRKSFH